MISSREMAYLRGKHIGYFFSIQSASRYIPFEKYPCRSPSTGWKELEATTALQVLEKVGLGQLNHSPRTSAGISSAAIARALAMNCQYSADDPNGTWPAYR
jgi:predicted ABC-type transport system involved in lysophospholipase L1 biosynthesis ATPase subunit